jgi:type III pantothenate kinase
VLLAVDVGNTQTHLGVFDGDRLVEHWRLATEAEATADELAVTISGLLATADLRPDAVEGSIVSTVVPALGPEYEGMCERHLGRACLMVGPNLKTGMAIKIDNPHELGADRLVNAVAAYERFDSTCVAVDFGTSTNFDAVSEQGEYLGGVIGPGLEISIEALSERTAKLPRFRIAAPGAALGKNTEACLQSGFVYGFAGLVDGISRRLRDELGKETEFVATGGLARGIVPFTETLAEIDDLLTLTGLRLINERNA